MLFAIQFHSLFGRKVLIVAFPSVPSLTTQMLAQLSADGENLELDRALEAAGFLSLLHLQSHPHFS